MKAEKIWFENGRIYLLSDTGRTGSLPLKAFPRLYNATEQQRNEYTLSPMGIHWEALDEDLSFDGFFHPEDQNNQIKQIFDALPEININQFARIMGINQSLMAKYICGVKMPSEQRKQQIVDALHRLGAELSAISL